jgi:uncharacterized membrane protein YgdD (TMEM256/DUF423 family)
MSPARTFLALGAVLAGLGVAAGAFAAHALAEVVPPARIATFETAARYQVYHALALLAVGLLAERSAPRALRAAGWLFVAGTALFSGSLYLLVLTDTPALGAVTPLGGVAFLSGWALLAWHALRERGSAEPPALPRPRR